MRCFCSVCCAPAPNGQTVAAPPNNAMKSRPPHCLPQGSGQSNSYVNLACGDWRVEVAGQFADGSCMDGARGDQQMATVGRT